MNTYPLRCTGLSRKTVPVILLFLSFGHAAVFAQRDSAAAAASRAAAAPASAAASAVSTTATAASAAAHDTSAPKKPRAMGWRDIPSWKYIAPQKAELSPDGKWLAWPLLTTEGDGELIVKSTKDTTPETIRLAAITRPGLNFPMTVRGSPSGNLPPIRRSGLRPKRRENRCLTSCCW